MPEAWTADVVAQLHLNGLSRKQLARAAGYTPDYITMILNGHRGTTSDKTRKTILDALDRLVRDVSKCTHIGVQ